MNVIEIDAASNNGVENIRQIREEVSYSPTQGKYKVYIIDEVHMLSIGAFNALLKTLEEPPSYVIFILATTESHKIPITILSRCQKYDFRRISIETISDRLMDLLQQEGVEAEEKAVRYVAKAGDGSMRDALSLLDQCIAFYLGEPLTYDHVLEVLGAVDTEVFSRLLRSILANNVVQAIELLEELAGNIKETALCGLGQTAPNPVLSTLKYFRDEYEAHIKEKRCPAGVCEKLANYQITDKCKGCGLCARQCRFRPSAASRAASTLLIPLNAIKCGSLHGSLPV